jgi:translocation protein SEC63
VSDTFAGKHETVYLKLKVDELCALDADEQGVEDDISDPQEALLTGHIAAMHDETVKKLSYHGESNDGSTMEGDEDSGSAVRQPWS